MALLVFFLPFTSFPPVSRLIRSGMVAPLSIVPMALLLLFWLAPHLLRSGKLPPHAVPLLGFASAAVISSAAAFFLPFPAFKGASPLRSEVEAFASLGVGICFYFLLAVWPRDMRRLRFLLGWVNWSGAFLLAWSLLQAVIWQRFQNYPDWLWNSQAAISTSQLLYVARVTGFAYEPSWLAHQLNMLYLPIWMGAAFTGFTAHRLRIWKIHFEHLLLIGGIAVLVLSVSRIGLLTFLSMVALLILLLNVRMVRWAMGSLLNRFAAEDRRAVLVRRWFPAASVFVLAVVYVGLMIGAAYGLSRYDVRMMRLFDFSTLREQSFMHYANQLVFAERIVFWQAGWGVFNDYPVLGVGLGNAGFFFAEKLSAFSWALTEIRTLMYYWTSLPNIKSMWVRLLAETGMVGFALFACWLLVLWHSAGFLRSVREWNRAIFGESQPLYTAVGTAGALGLVGFLIEGFSIDTFGLPYYWILFGLVTCACEQARRCVKSLSGEKDSPC